MPPGRTRASTSWTSPGSARVPSRPPASSWPTADSRPAKVSLLTGREKRGKSTAAFDLLTALVTGQDWMGLIPCRRCPVLLFDFENPPNYLWKNLRGMLDQRGADLGEVDRWIGVADPDKIRERTRGGPEEYALRLIEAMGRRTGQEAGLLVIDTALPAFRGLYEDANWTNSNSQVREALETVQRIARRTGWHVCVIYHENKGGTGAAGSYEWTATVDCFMRYDRDPAKDPGTLTFEGRSLDKPDPVKFVREGLLLKGRYRGVKAGDGVPGEEDAEYQALLASIPAGEANAAKQSDVVDRSGLSKARVMSLLARADADGAVGKKKGPKNATLRWRMSGGPQRT